jgi:hypothetical protein
VSRVTPIGPGRDEALATMKLKVAFVSRDPIVRLAGAKALEGAPEEWVIELGDHAPSTDADVVVCGPDVPGCRGIRFDPAAAPGELVESIVAAARRTPVIAVGGACGGCGVTTVALHLAQSYGSCVVECGRRAGLAERLGLDRDELRTWGPDDPDGESVDLAALPMSGGYRAFVAPPHESTGIEYVVDAARERFDSVVLDVPLDHELPVPCDAYVAVMPATLPGARRTRALLQDRDIPGTRAVVANRLGPGGESTRGTLQRALGDTITLELPTCPALRDAEDDGALLPLRHRWARRLDRLAQGLYARARCREDSVA